MPTSKKWAIAVPTMGMGAPMLTVEYVEATRTAEVWFEGFLVARLEREHLKSLIGVITGWPL
jgi:hypothetical protein